MTKELATKLFNVLNAEFDYIGKNEKDKDKRTEKMNEIIRMEQIILNFDELEPTLKEYFRKKAEKEKWER